MAETTHFPDQPWHSGVRARRPDAAVGAQLGGYRVQGMMTPVLQS